MLRDGMAQQTLNCTLQLLKLVLSNHPNFFWTLSR